MLTVKQGIRLSAIIDKLGLSIPDALINLKAGAVLDEALQKRAGADLVMQLLRNAHKAEKELYALIADTKGITPEAAAEVDLLEFAKDFVGPDVASFFTSAVRLQLPESSSS